MKMARQGRRHTDQIITAADLSEYLSSQDDFALELFVYHKAREYGFITKHGGTYLDPITKKPRQFDVRAYFQVSPNRLHLAIECKSLRPTYPLLLSRIPRSRAESFHQLISCDNIAGSTAAMRRRNNASRSYATIVRHVGSRSIYHAGDFVAKTMTQVCRDNDGHLKSGDAGVYDKWSQALASADELVSLAEYGYLADLADKKLLTFVLPVLVVSDGALWVADYSEDGREVSDPVQIDESVLFVGRDYSGPKRISYTISHLHILTKKQVGSFFERLFSEYWRQIFHRPDERNLGEN
jgi:hypothetical protein